MVYRVLGKLLALADAIVIVIILFALHFSQEFVLLGAVYLLAKGLFFILISRDIVSIFDVLCGFYVVLISVGLHFKIATIAAVLFLAQKVLLGLL